MVFFMPPQRSHVPSVDASLSVLFHFHPPPRKVLLLELRRSGLWAELKALHAQSQELESAVGHRQLLLRELQAKRQRILQWRQLVVRSQAQWMVRVGVWGPETNNWVSTASRDGSALRGLTTLAHGGLCL